MATSAKDSETLQILTIDFWGGTPALNHHTYGTVPWYVYYMGAPGDISTDEDHCRNQVRLLHTYDTDYNARYGARFNFLICGDGNVYESRGWHSQPFLPVKYRPQQPIAILLGFVGVKLAEDMTRAMSLASYRLVEHGKRNGFLTKTVSPRHLFAFA